MIIRLPIRVCVKIYLLWKWSKYGCPCIGGWTGFNWNRAGVWTLPSKSSSFTVWVVGVFRLILKNSKISKCSSCCPWVPQGLFSLTLGIPPTGVYLLGYKGYMPLGMGVLGCILGFDLFFNTRLIIMSRFGICLWTFLIIHGVYRGVPECRGVGVRGVGVRRVGVSGFGLCTNVNWASTRSQIKFQFL